MTTKKSVNLRVILLPLLLIALIPAVFSLNINLTYKIDSNTVEKGQNLTFNLINITSDEDINVTFQIKFDNSKVFEENLSLKANQPKLINNVKIKVDDFYKKFYLLVYNKSNNQLLKNVSGNIYVYYLTTKRCKLDDYIIKEDDNAKLSLKFRDENKNLNKRLEIYLDNDLEKKYDFDDEIEKELDLDMDDLYESVKCKVKVKDTGKYIYSKELPVLVYNIDKPSFEFEDYDKLKVKLKDFDLSNKNNKVKFKISVADYDYNFEWDNKTSLDDFTINLFENDEIKDNEDKIDLIKELLEELTSKEGIEIDYDLTLYLYKDNKEIDSKDVFLDESYYTKDFPKDENIKLSDNNDFKMDVLSYNKTIEQFDYFTAKLLLKAKKGNDFDVKVCMAIDGDSYCKTVTLDEDDEDKKEKIIELSKYMEKPGNYKVVFYAYDEDNSRIIWKTENFEVKPVKAVILNVLNQILVGYENETKNLKVQLENPSTLKLNVNLVAKCGNEMVTKTISLNPEERKVIEIPIKLKEDCDGFVKANVKMLQSNNEFSVLVRKPLKSSSNETQISKNKETLKCTVPFDLIYSKGDNLSFKVVASNGSKVTIMYNDNLVTVVPSTFISKGENTVTVLRKTDDTIIDNLEIICEKNGENKTTEITIYFYKKEKPWYKDTNKIILASAVTSAVLILIIAFLLFI